MFVVIFEVYLTQSGRNEYFSMAADLRKFLTDRPGFISIERFQSTSDRNKLLSISFWENEEAIAKWRNLFEHRVARVIRDYTYSERIQAPSDSNAELSDS